LDETAPRKFTELLQFLEHDCIHGLLLPDELVSLKKLLEDRRKLHNSQVSSVEARKSLHYHTREIWALTPFINNFPKLSIYIDGCNLLLSDSQWNAMTKKLGQTAAREDLLAKCKSKAKLFKTIQLIFDGVGSQNTSEKIEAGLTLYFAAQLQADQNADNYLVQLLKDTPKAEGELRWVVTDDMGLRYRVETLCEAIVPTSSFAQFLRIS
ncbi:MAG: NYN domain-containing protein, partial [Lentisphaeria bacterium]